jgi:hypothetical protein
VFSDGIGTILHGWLAFGAKLLAVGPMLVARARDGLKEEVGLPLSSVYPLPTGLLESSLYGDFAGKI